MKLSEAKIKQNATKFFETAEKFKVINDDLTIKLGIKFVDAPSVTKTDMGNAFAGGLIKHILTVTKYMVSLNNVLPDAMKLKEESLFKISLLHQIGKYDMYTPFKDDWHIKKGWMYDFKEQDASMRVGARSLKMAMDSGINFTDQEYVAILNWDSDESDKQARYHNSLLGDLLKSANMLATQESLYK